MNRFDMLIGKEPLEPPKKTLIETKKERLSNFRPSNQSSLSNPMAVLDDDAGYIGVHGYTGMQGSTGMQGYQGYTGSYFIPVVNNPPIDSLQDLRAMHGINLETADFAADPTQPQQTFSVPIREHAETGLTSRFLRIQGPNGYRTMIDIAQSSFAISPGQNGTGIIGQNTQGHTGIQGQITINLPQNVAVALSADFAIAFQRLGLEHMSNGNGIRAILDSGENRLRAIYEPI